MSRRTSSANGDLVATRMSWNLRRTCAQQKANLGGFVRLAGDQAAKPGITIHLEQAAEPAQMRLWMFARPARPWGQALAILAVDIGSGRMAGPTPKPGLAKTGGRLSTA